MASIAQPILYAAEIPRHLDPATLPEENPDPGKLFKLYYNIFHETAAENFTGARIWLDWANKVHALSNLSQTLGEYYNLTGIELGMLEEVNTSLTKIHLMTQRLETEKASTAIIDTLGILKKANSTIVSLESKTAKLGQILSSSTSDLDLGILELRNLIRLYSTELQRIRNSPDITINPQLERPTLKIELEKGQVMVGEILMVRGTLSNQKGEPLPNRLIYLYFDDKRVGNTSTTNEGNLKMEFIVPFVYKQNTTVYAEYNPQAADSAIFGRAISNIIPLQLIWYQPKISVNIPNTAYPGIKLKVSGLVSYEGGEIPGLNVTVITLGVATNDKTSQMGTYLTTITVPAGYPEGTQQILVQTKAAGLFAPAENQTIITITRYPSSLHVSVPTWVFSGSKLAVTGIVESQNTSIEGCVIELRSDVGSSSTTVGADGGFKAEVDLPLTLFTSTYGYQVFTQPKPWIRPSSASGSALVINSFTLVGVPLIIGAAAFIVARRIRLKPRPKSEPKIPQATNPSPTTTSPHIRVDEEPRDLTSIFNWVAKQVDSRFATAMGDSMTIREWLESLKGKVDSPLYGSVERLGLMHERSIYGKPHEEDSTEAKSLLAKIREFLL